MDFVVECIPRPWPKKLVNRKTGMLYRRDKGGKFREYEKTITATVLNQNQGTYDIFVPLKPLILICHFFIPRPKSTKRPLPMVRPDLDNYAYAISNILQGICYKDDGQIVKLTATKNYADKKILLGFPNFDYEEYSRNFLNSHLEPAFKTHVSDYLSQCRQPFTGVFIRVEEVM